METPGSQIRPTECDQLRSPWGCMPLSISFSTPGRVGARSSPWPIARLTFTYILSPFSFQQTSRGQPAQVPAPGRSTLKPPGKLDVYRPCFSPFPSKDIQELTLCFIQIFGHKFSLVTPSPLWLSLLVPTEMCNLIQSLVPCGHSNKYFYCHLYLPELEEF